MRRTDIAGWGPCSSPSSPSRRLAWRCSSRGPTWIRTRTGTRGLHGRTLLLDPMDVRQHWVWLPLWQYVYALAAALGRGIEDVRLANVLVAALVPLLVARTLLEALDRRRDATSAVERMVPFLAGVLTAIGRWRWTTDSRRAGAAVPAPARGGVPGVGAREPARGRCAPRGGGAAPVRGMARGRGVRPARGAARARRRDARGVAARGARVRAPRRRGGRVVRRPPARHRRVAAVLAHEPRVRRARARDGARGERSGAGGRLVCVRAAATQPRRGGLARAAGRVVVRAPRALVVARDGARAPRVRDVRLDARAAPRARSAPLRRGPILFRRRCGGIATLADLATRPLSRAIERRPWLLPAARSPRLRGCSRT